LYNQKLSSIKIAVEENGFLFVQSERPIPSAPSAVVRDTPQIIALQAENKRIKIGRTESETTLLSQKEMIGHYQNAGLLQRSLDDQRQNGTVVMSQLQSEHNAMPNVKWRPVASAILYSISGAVRMFNNDIVFKQTFYQLKRDGIFNRWIRYETRTCKKILRLEWQAEDGLFLQSIEEVVSWIKQKQSK